MSCRQNIFLSEHANTWIFPHWKSNPTDDFSRQYLSYKLSLTFTELFTPGRFEIRKEIFGALVLKVCIVELNHTLVIWG